MGGLAAPSPSTLTCAHQQVLWDPQGCWTDTDWYLSILAVTKRAQTRCQCCVCSWSTGVIEKLCCPTSSAQNATSECSGPWSDTDMAQAVLPAMTPCSLSLSSSGADPTPPPSELLPKSTRQPLSDLFSHTNTFCNQITCSKCCTFKHRPQMNR